MSEATRPRVGRSERRPLGATIWFVWMVAMWAGFFALLVALSRIYRGMHHPIDAAGGVLVGIGAIVVVLFACRCAAAAADLRSSTAMEARDR